MKINKEAIFAPPKKKLASVDGTQMYPIHANISQTIIIVNFIVFGTIDSDITILPVCISKRNMSSVLSYKLCIYALQIWIYVSKWQTCAVLEVVFTMETYELLPWTFKISTTWSFSIERCWYSCLRMSVGSICCRIETDLKFRPPTPMFTLMVYPMRRTCQCVQTCHVFWLLSCRRYPASNVL